MEIQDKTDTLKKIWNAWDATWQILNCTHVVSNLFQLSFWCDVSTDAFSRFLLSEDVYKWANYSATLLRKKRSRKWVYISVSHQLPHFSWRKNIVFINSVVTVRPWRYGESRIFQCENVDILQQNKIDKNMPFEVMPAFLSFRFVKR